MTFNHGVRSSTLRWITKNIRTYIRVFFIFYRENIDNPENLCYYICKKQNFS